MARFLFQLAYTPEAWAAQLRNPRNRVEVVSPDLARLGGRVECAYFAFGDYDLVGVLELPDNVSASAFAMAVMAGGGGAGVQDHAAVDDRGGPGGHAQGSRNGLPAALVLRWSRCFPGRRHSWWVRSGLW